MAIPGAFPRIAIRTFTLSINHLRSGQRAARADQESGPLGRLRVEAVAVIPDR